MKLKYLVQSIGIIISVSAWLLEKHDHYQFIYPIVVPKYVNAMDVYNKMYERNFLLYPTLIGFSEISEILKQHISEKEISVPLKLK